MNGHTTRNTAVALSLLLITLSGCKSQLFEAVFAKAVPAEVSATMVTLRIGATDSLAAESAGRSIMPSAGTIDGYDLYGAKTGGTQTLLKTFASLTGSTITLEAGTWDFTLKARKDATTVILLGSKSSVVLSETTASVDFTLAPLASGKGSVDVTVNWPSPSTVVSVVASIGGVDEATPLTITGSGPYSIKFNKDLDPGTYLVSFRFLDSHSAKVLVYSERATIVPILMSPITTSLSDTDFNAVPNMPTGITVTTTPKITGTTVTGFTLTWTDASDNETGFNIYLSSNTTTPAGAVLAGVTTWTDGSTNIDRGQPTPSYFVTAVNGFGLSSRQSSPVSGVAPFLISYDLGYTPAGSAPTATEAVPSGNATLPAPPSRDRYDFGGWYSGAGGTGAQLTSSTSVTASKTYIAKWTATPYAITYNLNSGTNSGSNPASYDVTTAAITLVAPTRTGCNFGGWYSDSGLLSASSSIASGSTGAKAFFAKWTAISYAITYNLNSGTNSGSNPASYDVTTAALTLADPTRTGYSFGGWYSNSGFSSASSSIASGSTGAKAFYAKWTLLTYLITYILNGGTNSSNNNTSYNVTANQNLYPPTLPEYAGSWCSDSTLTNTVEYIPSGSTGNKTFYAKLTAIPYTITYELDGGTSPSSPSNPTTYNFFTPDITLLAPTMVNGVFVGWYSDESLDPYYNVTSIVKGTKVDMTLYAKFTWIGPDQIAKNLSTSKDAYTTTDTNIDQLVRITKEEYALIASDSYLTPRVTGLAAFDETTIASCIGSDSKSNTFTTVVDTAPFTSSFPSGNGYAIAFKYVPGNKQGGPSYSPSIWGVSGNSDLKTVTGISASSIDGPVGDVAPGHNGIMYFAIKRPSIAIPYNAKLAVSTKYWSVAYAPEGSVKIYYRDAVSNSDWNLPSNAPSFTNGYPLYQVLTAKSVKW